jgi:Na+/proline symporter/signal transduction histidine kinase
MFDPFSVLGIIVLYMGVLFGAALWIERRRKQNRPPFARAMAYSLSLAIYCTTWTYYGSVGKAANSGMMFLGVYLGPTIAICLWWQVLRKMIRIKNFFRITSIADFISARYDKCQILAAMVTVAALVGTMPYIALQLRAVIMSFSLITHPVGTVAAGNDFPPLVPVVLVLIVLFTIVIGVRKLDPTERHEGMIAALSAECVLKLAAFLAAGVFVTYFLFDGFGDIIARIRSSPYKNLMGIGNAEAAPYLSWTTYLLLSMTAIFFLPRQFHVAVVENSDESDIRTAMWLFPLYMLLITLFVIPIALGGLLKGYPLDEADRFVLALPVNHGKPWLALLVFLGGFSAATGMVMVSSMTLATMITNHLLLPLVGWIRGFSFLRRHLLKCRWIAVAAVISLGYWFERNVGGSYILVNIGTISFAAAYQFAPVILGGMYWQRASRKGALLGLFAGFAVWGYTLLFPAFVKSGWFPPGILETGPFHIALLRPEHLLGLEGFDPYSHCLFWSTLFNAGCFVLGSLVFEQSRKEQGLAAEFVHALTTPASLETRTPAVEDIPLALKKEEIEKVLGQYFSARKSQKICETCVRKAGLEGRKRVSMRDLITLHGKVEKYLTGSIGASAAHRAMHEGIRFDEKESRRLSNVYAELLANLRVTPDELRRRVDYYRELEILLTSHARELEEKVQELNRQIHQRKKTEKELEKYRDHLEDLVEGRTRDLKTINEQLEKEILERKKAEDQILRLNRELEQRFMEIKSANRELESFSYTISHDLKAPLRAIDAFSNILLEDYSEKLDEEGRRLVRVVSRNTRRMGQLIHDLLAFSRLGRMEKKMESIDMEALVREVFLEVKAGAPGRAIDFRVKSIPAGCGDRSMMRQVWMNLISNAVKFTRRKSEAVIEIEGVRRQNEHRYSIRDNGAGFDMKYARKLFGVFQRLHKSGNFEGTGVGLAVVRQVIQAHGGRVWAESKPDRGAAFFFTLPVREDCGERG